MATATEKPDKRRAKVRRQRMAKLNETPRLSLDDRLDFLIIGAQKAGTSALDHYLRAHPRLHMAEGKKEVHFFDNEKNFELGTTPDYGLLHKHFRQRTGTKLFGECTPAYIYWPSAIQRIHQYNPKLKLIAVLRNPISRAYSNWNMERHRGQENLSFSEAIEQEGVRIQNDATPQQLRKYSYVSRGYYSRQLEEIWKYFPKEQTLFVRQETLKSDPVSVVNQISDFLGVKHIDTVKEKDSNSRPYVAPLGIEDWRTLARLYESDIKVLEKMLGWDCSNWLQEPGSK